MKTIKTINGRIFAINEKHIVLACLGTPDQGAEEISYTPTCIETSTGSAFEIDQDDPENNEFLCGLFGSDWREKYMAQSAE